MVPKTNTTAKKAPTLKDSRFHSNNISQGIKALQRYQEKVVITEEDAHLIDEYLVKRKADKDLSQGRVTKILWTLLSWRQFVPPFRQNTMTDLYKGIDAIKTGTQKRTGHSSEPYSKNFVYDTVTIVKPFYLWMIEAGYSRLKEKDILALKRPKRDLMTKTVADILNEKEIKKMVLTCESTRDRAILMMLYDGGFRISELGRLTWGQISFDSYGLLSMLMKRLANHGISGLLRQHPTWQNGKMTTPSNLQETISYSPHTKIKRLNTMPFTGRYAE